MVREQYLLPSETLVLLAFLIGPPLLVALIVQAYLSWRHGLFFGSARLRGALLLLATAVITLLLSTALLAASAAPAVRFLGVKEVHIAGQLWPVFPGAAVVAALVAALFTVLAVRHGRGKG